MFHQLTQPAVSAKKQDSSSENNDRLSERNSWQTQTDSRDGSPTYDVLLPLACSRISSPLGFTVNIRQAGTPTFL